MLRRLPRFEYLTPRTLEEATTLLGDYRGKAAVLAGGTDLLFKMKRREMAPPYLISLKGIPNLDGIRYSQREGLRLGPSVTIADVETSPLIRERFPVLAEAADNFGSVQIRNVATVSGNLCNSAPSADTIPPLIALGASLRLISPRGERVVPVEEFFTTPFHTVLAQDELLAEIQVPNQPPGSAGAYLKYMLREAMDRAFVNVAAVLTLEGNTCRQAKIVVGVCSYCWRREECRPRCPFPTRATGAEEVLRGQTLEERLIEQAAKRTSRESRPRVDPVYKRQVIEVFTRRALKLAWQAVRAAK